MESTTPAGSPRCCERRWVSIIPTQWVGNAFLHALGVDGPPWPEVIAVCREHYKQVRRTDGIVLGFRRHKGVTKAVVQQELF